MGSSSSSSVLPASSEQEDLQARLLAARQRLEGLLRAAVDPVAAEGGHRLAPLHPALQQDVEHVDPAQLGRVVRLREVAGHATGARRHGRRGRRPHRRLAGEPVGHDGEWRLGARVVPGYFSQTHDHPELRGTDVLDIVMQRGVERGKAMAALRRYGIHGCAQQAFETLSGGQQARLQILLLELAGSTLLLLDEPTDNLDLASAEALEDALDSYVGTVVAVTHDRWFLRGFDRFLVFGRDATVTEHLEPGLRVTPPAGGPGRASQPRAVPVAELGADAGLVP